MSCTYLNALRIVRHDKIVQVITRVARLAGVATHIEPRIDDEDKSRGDGHLFFHSQSSIFDVKVVDPCAQTYVVAAQHPLGAATASEAKKVEIYGARCRQQGFQFYPVILECFGALGVRCRDLVDKIDEEARLNGVVKINGFNVKTYLLRALSFCLQQGNALLMAHGSIRSRKLIK